MILTDTGPLVAMLDPTEDSFAACNDVMKDTSLPMVTTWACLTEAMHFAGRQGEFTYQARLLKFLNDGVVEVFEAEEFEDASEGEETFVGRIGVLMDRYKDLPMDFADASLVAASESLRTRKIFTLDRKNFSIYRTFDGGAFEIVP